MTSQVTEYQEEMHHWTDLKKKIYPCSGSGYGNHLVFQIDFGEPYLAISIANIWDFHQ